MSRPRIPTAQLEATGAFVKNPDRGRARKHEPKPDALMGGPPKHLKEAEKKVWLEIAGKLVAGVAANSDEASFELLVCLISDFRQRRKRGVPQPVGEYAAMNKLLTQFGMTPADRTRVSAKPGAKKKAGDPLEKFLDDDAESTSVN